MAGQECQKGRDRDIKALEDRQGITWQARHDSVEGARQDRQGMKGQARQKKGRLYARDDGAGTDMVADAFHI